MSAEMQNDDSETWFSLERLYRVSQGCDVSLRFPFSVSHCLIPSQYEMSLSVFGGAFALFGFLPVIPGPCGESTRLPRFLELTVLRSAGLYRCAAVKRETPRQPGEEEDAVEFYLRIIEQDAVQCGLLFSTYKLAEDRVRCCPSLPARFSASASPQILSAAAVLKALKKGNETPYSGYEPRAVFYFQSEVRLPALVSFDCSLGCVNPTVDSGAPAATAPPLDQRHRRWLHLAPVRLLLNLACSEHVLCRRQNAGMILESSPMGVFVLFLIAMQIIMYITVGVGPSAFTAFACSFLTLALLCSYLRVQPFRPPFGIKRELSALPDQNSAAVSAQTGAATVMLILYLCMYLGFVVVHHLENKTSKLHYSLFIVVVFLNVSCHVHWQFCSHLLLNRAC